MDLHTKFFNQIDLERSVLTNTKRINYGITIEVVCYDIPAAIARTKPIGVFMYAIDAYKYLFSNGDIIQ